MNQFQQDILNRYPQFDIDDFTYFVTESEAKISAMNLPIRNCSINDIFVDCKNALYHQREYCLKNCGLQCKLPEYQIIR